MPIRVTLSLVVLVAAYTDLRSRRIPNWLTLPALPAGIAAQTLYGDGFWPGLLGAAGGFAALLLLFLAGAGGAGDVKLFAVVGSFVGIRNLLAVFVLVAVIGGVAAVVVSLRAGALTRVLKNSLLIAASFGRGRWAELRERSDMHQPGALRLAYGAVIAAGALVFLWYPR
ncbi:MAG TPA: A24 family peptidase [Bryobacteraceae bacterium]|nr:A24 family peptidase [Bryobacteraceae bacterium]